MVRSFWPSSGVRPWYRLLGSSIVAVLLAAPALAQSPEVGSAAPSLPAATAFEGRLPTLPSDANATGSPAAPLDPVPRTTAFNATVTLLDQPALPQLGDPRDFLPDEARTRLVLRLNDRRVYVYRGDEAVASYPVAIGRAGWETPKGSYAVMQMIKDPSWRHPWEGYVIPPGPDNPLGNRWIGFWTDGKNFIGFHGTPNESLIGQAVSHGCVRMRNQDIQALFAQVEIGTPVVVE